METINKYAFIGPLGDSQKSPKKHSVCPSIVNFFYLSARVFSWNWSIKFFLKLYMVLKFHGKLYMGAEFFKKQFFLPKNGDNRQRLGFFLMKSSAIRFFWILFKKKLNIIFYVPAQILYLGKISSLICAKIRY